MRHAPPGLARDMALFLDFDGTLVPLQARPDDVHLPEGGAATLQGIAEALGGALALVTGRDVRDLSRRVPNSLWRAGNHGLAIARPDAEASPLPAPPALVREAAENAASIASELWVETKGPVLAIHHRERPDLSDEIVRLTLAVIDPQTDYHIERGKGIVELKPRGANKGEAVRRLMTEQAFLGRLPVFIGDDTTDEDGFEAVLELGGISVKVGEGETIAEYRLGGPADVWQWLETGRDGIS